jgi:hypothetical protein
MILRRKHIAAEVWNWVWKILVQFVQSSAYFK